MAVTLPEEFANEPSLKAEFDGKERLRRAVFERDGETMELTIESSQRAAAFVESTMLRTKSASQLNDRIELWLRRMVDRARRVPRCAFCDKSDAEVARLIAGPESYICDECVEVCARILSEH